MGILSITEIRMRLLCLFFFLACGVFGCGFSSADERTAAETSRSTAAPVDVNSKQRDSKGYENVYASDAVGLEKLFLTLLEALQNSDRMAAENIVQRLMPDETSLRQAVKDPRAVERIRTWQEKNAAGNDYDNFDSAVKELSVVAQSAKRIVVKVYTATTEELIAYEEGSVAREHFSLGGQYSAASFLKPNTNFYVVQIFDVTEGLQSLIQQLLGWHLRTGLIYHDGKDWKLLGAVWRAFPVSLRESEERWRFWDIVNEVAAIRNRAPSELNENQEKHLSVALQEVTAFRDRLNWLADMLEHRQDFIESDFIKSQLAASVRGEISLPPGTRDRWIELKKLRDRFPSSTHKIGELTWLEDSLLEGRVPRGELFRLAIELRAALDNFVTLRGIEIAQDEFFLSFPTMRLRSLKEFKKYRESWEFDLSRRGYPPSANMTTARDLWGEIPKKAIRKNEFGIAPHEPFLSPDDLSTSFTAEMGGRKAFRVLSDAEFRGVIDLYKRLEGWGGGVEPLLIIPKVESPPSRKRLVEASRVNFNQAIEADQKAFIDLKKSLFSQLDERSKQYAESDKEKSEIELREELQSLLPKMNLSDYGLYSVLDLAIRLEALDEKVPDVVDLSDFSDFQQRSLKGRSVSDQILAIADGKTVAKYRKLQLKNRQEAFFSGARFYFGDQTINSNK